MRKVAEKQMADKAMGLTHESGHHMMEPSSDDTTGKKKKKTVCRNCGCTTHATSRSSKCMHNSWGKEALAKEMVRRGIALAAGTAAGVATEGGSSEVQSEGACDLILSLETWATCNFSAAQSTCVSAQTRPLRTAFRLRMNQSKMPFQRWQSKFQIWTLWVFTTPVDSMNPLTCDA
jgi:hypothetical protein